jgi:ADP-L-glycero-D-manno-heptose 6-epimerase
VGFRYFNVYGPREQHKGRMASVAFHHHGQMASQGKVKLFGDYGGYGPGEQSRDFIYIDDVVAVKLWFLQNPQLSGIVNLGTGRAEPFNHVASGVINALRRRAGQPELALDQLVAQGLVDYVPFPEALVGKYQCLTRADLSALRGLGCQHEFLGVAEGTARYVDWLVAQPAA